MGFFYDLYKKGLKALAQREESERLLEEILLNPNENIRNKDKIRISDISSSKKLDKLWQKVRKSLGIKTRSKDWSIRLDAIKIAVVAAENKDEVIKLGQKLEPLLINPMNNIEVFDYFNEARCKILDSTKEHEDLWMQVKSEWKIKSRAKAWRVRLKEFRKKVLEKKIKEIESKRIDFDFKVPTSKKEREEANALAHKLALEDRDDYTKEELEAMAKFTGFGGMGGIDTNEYYTPKELSKASWNLLDLKDGAKVLDPSCGAGIFSLTAPSGILIDGVELNPTSGTIANKLNPNTNVKISSFEEFANKNSAPIYDGVITNVPFGKRYKEYVQKDPKYANIDRAEDYFMLRSLDLLKHGKRAVFLTSSATAQRPNRENTRLKLLKKACFIGGYRLPSKMFKESGTDVVVDVLVFEKHPKEYFDQIANENYQNGNLQDAISMSDASQSFLEGKYFDENQDNILGEFLSQEKRLEKATLEGTSTHHQSVKDVVETDMTLESIKASLNKKISKLENKNDFGYSELIPKIDDSVTKKELALIETLEEEIKKEIGWLNNGNIGMSLNAKEFNKLFEDAQKAGIIKSKNNYYAPIILKKICLNNDINNTSNTLLKFLLMTPNERDKAIEDISLVDVISKYYNSKETLKSIKADCKEYGVNYNQLLSIISMGEDEELQALYEENPLLDKQISDVSPMGTPIYALDSLSKEDQESKEIALYIDNDSNAHCMSMSDAIKSYKGMRFTDAINKIQNIEKPDNISDSLFALKQSQLLEKIKDYRKIGDIESLAYSLDTINKYFPNFREKNRIIERVFKLAGNDLIRVFREKVEANIAKNSDLIESMPKINPEWVIESVSKNLYEEFVNKALYDTPMRLGNYIHIDSKHKAEIGVVKGIYATSYNETMSLLVYYIKEAIEGDREIYDLLKEALMEHSVVDIKDEMDLGDSSEPLYELRGAITDKLIEMARIYQNEDARNFARDLKGTIAQDTGLGKSITMLLTSILALKTGRSSRVLVITPNSVVDKLYAEFEKFMTNDWKKKLFVLNSDDFTEKIREIRANRNIRIIIASHSVISFFKLKSSNLQKLAFLPSESGEKPQPTPFYSLINTFPNFDDGKAYFENLQIDTIMIDEQQNFKNGVASIGLRKASHVPSKSHIILQYLCEYIRQSRGDYRGTISVTATPFTNSPSEIIANLTLSGGHIDNHGNPLPNFGSHKEFIESYIRSEEIVSPKVNGIGVSIADTFSGFKDFDGLKTIINNSVKFRDAESEQARVKGLKVKPDYEVVASKEEADPQIDQTFRNLSVLNEQFKVSKAQREALAKLTIDEIREDLHLTLQKTIGETFGYINKVKNLSNGVNFANGITSIIIKEGITLEDIKKALKGAKHFVFGLYKDKHKLSLEELEDLEIRQDAREYEHSHLGNEPKQIEMKIGATQAVRDLAPDFITKDDKHTYFNAYTIDDGDIASITNKLIKASIVDENKIYNLDHYPKYKVLISNMKDEYERKEHSKQIIFSDMPILTQRIIGQVVDNAYKDGVLPPLSIHYFNKPLGGLKSDKSNAVEIQEKFNNSINPDVMIYGIAGITGVDFNKNVSAVHLMNIPNTPDIHHQAMGRAVRQGNDIDQVKVYKYFTTGTFDIFLDKLVAGKDDWITQLKGDKDAPDEISLNTSSASQILSNAMNMFKGQGLSPDEAVEKYMEYQKNEILKEHAEINSIKIKKDIERLDHLQQSKSLLKYDPVRNVVKVISSQMDRYEHYAFKFGFAPFPSDMRGGYSFIWDIMDKADSLDKLYDVIANYFKNSQDKQISYAKDLVSEMIASDEERKKELQENVKELADVKRRLKTKKVLKDPVLLNQLKAKRTQLETFIEAYKVKSTTRAKLSDIMQKVGETYYPSTTTEDEVMEAIETLYTKEYERLLLDIKIYIDEMLNIDEKIETQRVRILAKRGDKDFNPESTVTYQDQLLTIGEVMEVI